MKFRFIFMYVYMCDSVAEYVHCMYKGACRGQKKVQDALELKLQMVINCLKWFLGTQSRSFARAASALNLWDVSPTPMCES